ncbi:MAG: hypothetical protein Q8R30_01975 [bacterium]|nr:hypothetical protein [bacterium]MDZ4285538.1 hypothetical protein [Candidatus Sungbacteria bacterium]
MLTIPFLILTVLCGFLWFGGVTAVIVKVLTVIFAVLTVLGLCGAFGDGKGRGTPPPPSSGRRL